ncbi:unnamed protein product [Rotaria socialis]|nr:unnamed protein product [Rotaria socialis]CAF3563667.1 unnamed protein product [Rotaria socialis]
MLYIVYVLVPQESTSSVILYATATTTPQFNQQPVSVDTQDDLSQYNYDHKDKQTIARENQFNLEGKNTAIRRKKKNPRMYTDSFAITCWSNVTKEKLLECTVGGFDRASIQYVCVMSEIGTKQTRLLQIFQLCQQTIPRTTTTHTDAVVSAWLRDYFRHPKRPKCLVIIGPTSTGKTSFPLSLPGRVCYFKGRLCLNTWSDDARYLVFDDIPWDEFENRNFPSKKDLLSANGAVAVTDKYQPTVTINVIMPSIVLLNPGDEGSLTAIPVTEQEQRQAKYWTKRAVVY